MEDIHFKCPHCSQHLSSPPEGAGVEIVCPTCQAGVLVPAAPLGSKEPATDGPGPSEPLPPPPPLQAPESNGPGSLASETERNAGVPGSGPPGLIPLPPPPPPAPGSFALRGSSSAVIEPQPGEEERAEPEPPCPAPAGTAQGERTFEEAQQWGTVCDSLSPENIYHGTQMRGDISMPISILVSDNTVELRLRAVTPNELTSFLTSNLPWLAACVLAPFQNLLGLCLTPVLLVLSLLAPWQIPFLIWDGLLYFIGVFVSTVNLFRFLAEYIKALLAYATKSPWTFSPRGVELKDGRLVRFAAGQRLQLLRVEVSESLLKRVVKRARKAEEEDMGLVGMIIGLARLLLLPFYAVGWVGRVAFAAIGLKPGAQVLFVFVEGPPVDLEAPIGFVSRWKKKRQEEKLLKERTLFMVRVPGLIAGRIQQAIESALLQRAAVVDDTLAKKTIWRELA